ncbi:MAG: glycosyltransferase [Ignavibacteria bacterium]|nr:glycosyltransferase [Ignavibacteria bacterium]
MPWENYHREQFIRSIAAEIKNEGGLVICIEPTILSIFNILKYPERIISWIKGKNKFRKDGSNIYVTHAKTFEHILSSSRFGFLSFINSKLLKRQIRKILKKVNGEIVKYVWVLHRPELYFLVGNTGEAGAVYDCCDDHILTSDMNQKKVSGNREREKKLSEKCNFVIATSNKLFSRNKGYNPNTYLVENSYNFTRAETDENAVAMLKEIKGPIAGYIGIIRGWIDFELLEYVLHRNSGITFVFVGEIYKDSVQKMRELESKYPNLLLTGRVNYNALPGLLKYFNVGIIPFKNNEFMESVNPNKFYEMLSCAVPIVTTNIGDLKSTYGDICKVADTKEEFSRLVNDIMNMSEAELKQLKTKMFEISSISTWQSKSKIFHQLLNEHILNK